MAKITIAPLDDVSKNAQIKDLMKSVYDRGYASGLQSAAEMLDLLAADHRRLVLTNTVRDVADALRDKAASLQATAYDTINTLEKNC